MNKLTEQEIWDNNKMIAEACGLVISFDYDGCPIYKGLAGKKDRVMEGDHLVDDLTFEPDSNWDDFFIAYESLGVYRMTTERIRDLHKAWLFKGPSSMVSSSIHQNPQIAAYVCLCNYVKEFFPEIER